MGLIAGAACLIAGKGSIIFPVLIRSSGISGGKSSCNAGAGILRRGTRLRCGICSSLGIGISTSSLRIHLRSSLRTLLLILLELLIHLSSPLGVHLLIVIHS